MVYLKTGKWQVWQCEWSTCDIWLGFFFLLFVSGGIFSLPEPLFFMLASNPHAVDIEYSFEYWNFYLFSVGPSFNSSFFLQLHWKSTIGAPSHLPLICLGVEYLSLCLDTRQILGLQAHPHQTLPSALCANLVLQQHHQGVPVLYPVFHGLRVSGFHLLMNFLQLDTQAQTRRSPKDCILKLKMPALPLLLCLGILPTAVLLRIKVTFSIILYAMNNYSLKKLALLLKFLPHHLQHCWTIV